MQDYLITNYDIALSGSKNSHNHQFETVNKQTVFSTRQLKNTDVKIHDLTNPTDLQIDLLLPNPAKLGKMFLIVNDELSRQNFHTNQTIIYPGDRYLIVFNGYYWLEL